MDKLIDKIFYKARSVRLEADEKASIKANVMSFMRSHESPEKQSSPYAREFSLLVLFSQKKYALTFAVLLIVVLTGGTSFAAAGALPGDLLYGVKLNVNEGVESLLAVSPRASAEVNAKHAVARLKEAETLATAGKLTPEANKELGDNFSQSIASLNKNTESLKESGDFKAIAQVSINLEDGLNAHYAALQVSHTIHPQVSEGTISNDASTSSEGTNTMTMMMAPMAAALPTTSTTTDNQMSAKGKMMAAGVVNKTTESLEAEGRAEAKIREARTLISPNAATTSENSKIASTHEQIQFARVQITIGSISSLQAAARLTLGDQYIVLGKAAFNAGQFDQANLFFSRAEKAAIDAENLYTGDSSSIDATSTEGTSAADWSHGKKGIDN